MDFWQDFFYLPFFVKVYFCCCHFMKSEFSKYLNLEKRLGFLENIIPYKQVSTFLGELVLLSCWVFFFKSVPK